MSKSKVSHRALEGRIKRSLEKQNEVLKKCRADSHWFQDFGEYFIVDLNTNAVTAQHLDLEKLGRELHVLKDYEEMAS